MSKETIRIRTTPNGGDKHISMQIEQKFDFIEILSLSISQDDSYRRYCSDYGVVVGRVTVNSGFGVPNAKVSIFIPIDEEDKDNPEIYGLYPYENIKDKNSDGYRYNLLPKRNGTLDDCYTPTGSFYNKREIQDNEEILDIYTKYYKYTTVTNDAGDYMLFGVPLGTYQIHVETDISDIGIASFKPYDLIRDGASEQQFESGSKFKNSTNLETLTQIKLNSGSVSVIPFWGDLEQCTIGITRNDVNLPIKVEPQAIFMGSIFGDNEKNSVNRLCRPRDNMGTIENMVTGEGKIEMIRKTILGVTETFNIDGAELIDDNGIWSYQVPMNLDYVITDEFGNLTPTDDPNKGIPTRARVRFRIGMDNTGGEAKLRTRAKFLVPHNPDNYNDSDYSFDDTTKDKHFQDLYWNKIYSIANHIPRFQNNIFGGATTYRSFIGVKNVDGGNNSPFPFNRMDATLNPIYSVFCIIITIIAILVILINSILINAINIVFLILNDYVLTPIFALLNGFAAALCWLITAISFSSDDDYEACVKEKGIEPVLIPYIGYILLDCQNEAYCPGCSFDADTPGARATYERLTKEAWDYNQPKIDALKNDIAQIYQKIKDEESKPVEEQNKDLISKLKEDKKAKENELALLESGTKTISVNAPEIDDGTVPPFDAGWTNCTSLTIADALDVFKFDFYNDWVNGGLYSFLLKYKIRTFFGKGKEKFCELDCGSQSGVDNNKDGEPDNSCFSNYIVDTCYLGQDDIGIRDAKTIEVTSGVIKKFKGQLYYAAISRNPKSIIDEIEGIDTKPTDEYKLFATKIICLGSATDCDWQGIPKIHEYLIETTYNRPPLTETLDGSRVVESGFNRKTNNLSSSQICTINCIGISVGAQQCNNIRRLCEFGMVTDEGHETNTGSITSADAKVTNDEVSNAFVRGAFAYANGTFDPKIPNKVQLIFIDKEGGDNVYKYNWEYYEKFRGLKNNTIDFYNNSFYFYFGLIAGKSAINKMNSQFFPPCDRRVTNGMNIILNEVTPDNNNSDGVGSIDYQISGGIPPFKYEWFGPYINNVQYYCCYDEATGKPCNNTLNNCQNTGSLNNLFAGTYTLVVTDSLNNLATTTITVGGPQGVSCSTMTTTTMANGNGKVKIFIYDGKPPYTASITKLDANGDEILVSKRVLPTLQANDIPKGGYCFGYCKLAEDGRDSSEELKEGEYVLKVEDSSKFKTTCSTVFNIDKPTELVLDLYHSSLPTKAAPNIVRKLNCYGDNTGSAEVNVSGGVPPYTYEYKLINTDNLLYKNKIGTVYGTGRAPIGLNAGTYEIKVTDTTNTEKIKTFTILESKEIFTKIVSNYSTTFDTNDITKTTNNNQNNGFLRVQINGDNPPFNLELLRKKTKVIVKATIANSGEKVDFLGLDSDDYTITVTDSKRCKNLNIVNSTNAILPNKTVTIGRETNIIPKHTLFVKSDNTWDGINDNFNLFKEKDTYATSCKILYNIATSRITFDNINAMDKLNNSSIVNHNYQNRINGEPKRKCHYNYVKRTAVDNTIYYEATEYYEAFRHLIEFNARKKFGEGNGYYKIRINMFRGKPISSFGNNIKIWFVRPDTKLNINTAQAYTGGWLNMDETNSQDITSSRQTRLYISYFDGVNWIGGDNQIEFEVSDGYQLNSFNTAKGYIYHSSNNINSDYDGDDSLKGFGKHNSNTGYYLYTNLDNSPFRIDEIGNTMKLLNKNNQPIR
jgi:hypothetical protein